jgi:hypothetical protein
VLVRGGKCSEKKDEGQENVPIKKARVTEKPGFLLPINAHEIKSPGFHSRANPHNPHEQKN